MTLAKTKKDTPSRPFTGWHMLLIMIAFFGLIIGVNLTMAFFATKSWTGLIVKNSYVASQKFNETIALQASLKREGWFGSLEIEKNQFFYDLSKQKKTASDCQVSGIVKRPVHENNDIPLDFQALGQGRYSAVKKLAPGQWVLSMAARCPEMKTPFKQDYRFVVSPQS